VVWRSAAYERLVSTDARVVSVVAAAGWGKSTLLADAIAGPATRWLRLEERDRDPVELWSGLRACVAGRDADDEAGASSSPPAGGPSAMAADVADRLTQTGVDHLVLDDVHVLADSDSIEVVRALAAQLPASVQLLTAGRRQIGLVDDRQRGRGEVLELDACGLALDLETIAQAVADDLDPDRALAARLRDATGGWPVALRFGLDGLEQVDAADRSAALDRLLGASGPIGRYLRREVLDDQEERTRETLVQVHLLGRASVQRLARVTGTPVAAADEAVAALLRRGLVRSRTDQTDVVELTSAVQRGVEDHLLPQLERAADLVDAVVDALIADGDVATALEVLSRHERHPAAAALLEMHGDRLIRAGHLELVAQAAEALPEPRRAGTVALVQATALAFQGQWERAIRALEGAGLDPEGPLETELATLLGLVHYTRGDLPAALAAFARGPADEDRPAFAVLLGWRATAHWLRGEVEQAAADADRAYVIASRHADDAALAGAHTALALVAASDGDRRGNLDHYRQALTAARQADDRLQEARILTNLGSHHLEEGRYEDALEVTGRAIDLAEQQGFATLIGVARCNRAEALLSTGAVDEAIADAERAREVFARIGSRTEGYAHHILGAARAERGELALARRAYLRAIELGRDSGDHQSLVPAHLGLAWLLTGTDPDAAAEAIEAAQALDSGMAAPEVAAADAWVALSRGDRETAATLARKARELAAARDDQPTVARALTCEALTHPDPLPGLRDALELWQELGAELWSARVELGISHRSSDPLQRARTPELERTVERLGCPPERSVWAAQVLTGSRDPGRTVLRALGTFTAVRDGEPVPASAWGSRKARELVKVLIVRAPRPVGREELGHLLWPDEPYGKVSARLSTALSLARAALAGPDGQRDDGPLRTNGGSVGLTDDALEIDAVTFRDLAVAGLRAARERDAGTAVALLREAEARYGGDLFEDDPDLPWAEDRRHELRALYLDVARTLAVLVVDDAPEHAIQLLLRVLDRDGYDEPAHLNLTMALLRAGRHGEARRRYRLYQDRMAELELPAVPFHEVIHEARPANRRIAS
jgi:ATP/maltotriose-dependent transcriptional regulator MalT/DNA-binding SARP family transcriptional activator